MAIPSPLVDQKAIKLSIIIPVYNAENSLADAFGSILSQDVDQNLYEVIVVDDGSVDFSLNIIRDFEWKFKNFKYLTQQNSGVSVARNRALELVSGEYVLFLDSDDTFKNNALSYISGLLDNNDSDIYFFDTSYSSDLVKYEPSEFLSDVYFSVYVWKTCIKYQLIRENDLRFAEGFVLEDGVFLLEAIIKSSEVTTLKLDLVSYNYNENSLTRDSTNKKKNLKMISSFVFIINKYHQIINNVKDSISPRTYLSLMERKESFVFFMFFRMVRYKFSNHEIEENLKRVQFNVFTAFPGNHHNHFKYKGLALLMENRHARNLINFAYRAVTMELPSISLWIKRDLSHLHLWNTKNLHTRS